MLNNSVRLGVQLNFIRLPFDLSTGLSSTEVFATVHRAWWDDVSKQFYANLNDIVVHNQSTMEDFTRSQHLFLTENPVFNYLIWSRVSVKPITRDDVLDSIRKITLLRGSLDPNIDYFGFEQRGLQRALEVIDNGFDLL